MSLVDPCGLHLAHCACQSFCLFFSQMFLCMFTRTRENALHNASVPLCELLLFPHGHAQSVICGLREQHPTCFSYLVASSSLPAVLCLCLGAPSWGRACLSLVAGSSSWWRPLSSLLYFVFCLIIPDCAGALLHAWFQLQTPTRSSQLEAFSITPFVFCLPSCCSYLGSAPTLFAGRCMPLTTFTTCIE